MPAETHSHRVPIDLDEAARLVIERLGEILERDPDEIALDARLRDELGADDFAILELVESVEEELAERTVGFRIDDDDLGEIRTVRDAVECVLSSMHRETP
jgi:acyl carrier protein